MRDVFVDVLLDFIPTVPIFVDPLLPRPKSAALGGRKPELGSGLDTAGLPNGAFGATTAFAARLGFVRTFVDAFVGAVFFERLAVGFGLATWGAVVPPLFQTLFTRDFADERNPNLVRVVRGS